MIRLALVGVGRWGKNYLTEISQLKDCRVTYICARTEKTLSKFSSSYQKTTDYRELLTVKNIDGVIIATPVVTHFPITKDFINHGIPVLVEKPFTTSLNDALKLKKLSERTGSILMVGHEYLYNGAFQKLKETLPQLGKIKYISTEAGNWGPFRKDVSCLWDWGPHDVAMLIDLFSSLPQTVSAVGSNDTVNVRLKFSQVTAFIHLSRKQPQKVRQFVVVGEEGNIIYDELAQQKLTFYKHGVAHLNFAKVSPLKQELNEFISVIKSRRRPITDIKHAVKVTLVLSALERSLKKNQPVFLD